MEKNTTWISNISYLLDFHSLAAHARFSPREVTPLWVIFSIAEQGFSGVMRLSFPGPLAKAGPMLVRIASPAARFAMYLRVRHPAADLSRK
jgi:hypothetical protein